MFVNCTRVFALSVLIVICMENKYNLATRIMNNWTIFKDPNVPINGREKQET